jgi:hypothetical protein
MTKISKKTASKTEQGLNLQQEEFCKLYTNSEAIDRDMFGNGTQCYIEAYSVDLTKKGAYDWARVCASKLLTKANVIARINELLETGGFNNENVDKQHLFLINQHADLKTKLGAIKEFNTLKKRVDEKIKVDVHITGMKVVKE